MPQISAGYLYVASAFAGLLGITSLFVIPFASSIDADMRLEPNHGVQVLGESFTVTVVVESNTPVNVFQGDISFNADVLTVTSIDYNTSIADLWAEEPWYSNGDGTLNFIGGTTRAGGFTGTSALLTITFTTTATGEARVILDEARILKHDGLGSDAIVAAPIDALFAVTETELEEQTIVRKQTTSGPILRILLERPNTDLNGDGRQGIADTSIFMADLVSQNKRSDFNQDGVVNTADLSILLNAE